MNTMYSQNHAPWAQPGPANQMPQGPGSTQQPWGQQQQQSQPSMQSNTQFPGFHSGPSGQQLWNGGQQNSANQPANQASGQPWTPGILGGPEQQPQKFPPYYQQQQQQAQQQPQQNNQPQFGQSPQQGQQHFHNQQPNMPSGAAPWGGQQNQPWQQQGPPQQQPMLQQQISGPQGMPGPKVPIPMHPSPDCCFHGMHSVSRYMLPQQGNPAPLQPPNSGMGGLMGPGARPMLPSDYKLAPPPTNAYQTDLALAAAANSMTPIPMQPSVVPPRRVFSSALKLDEEARRRSEMATKQLMQNYHGPPNVGIKLMSKMGYGVAGTGLGAKGQGIAAPVQPVSLDGNSGLGFQMPPPLPDRRPMLRRRSPPPQRRARSPPPRRGRSPTPSRTHHRSSLSRSKSRSRSQSPRSPPRHGGRYKCEPPKWPPYPPARTIPDVSKRYGDMYIPPEFCRVTAGWVDSLPDHKPLSLEQPVDFQVKKEDQPTAAEPVDKAANPSGLSEAEKLSGSWWSAKVVLMSGAHSKVLHAEDPNTYQQTWRKLQFVVGRRGKHELLAVGGMWEPCDGAHPEKDPQVLVKTAARTFLEASGVDLSKCTKWHKFVEYSYLRAADKKHEVPEHIEKTVLFLVDASAIATVDPEAQDWDAKASSAKEAEEEAAAAVKAAWHAAKEAKEAAKELESLEKAKKEARKEAAKKAAADKEVKKESGDSTPARANSNSQPSPKAASGNTSTADLDKGSKDGTKAKEGGEDEEDCTPRDSEGNELEVDMDTSKLTAAQLQEELTKRGLDVKWQPLKGKKVLVDRLQEWMAMHKGKKEAQDVEAQRKAEVRNAVEPAALAYEEAKKKVTKASADRRAAVRVSNDPPPAASLALWPNKDFLDKRSKFGLDVLPLEALLDYNEDDVKECHFEVSMFAEMFKEMLQTRFARGLIRGMAIIEHQTEAERSKEKERLKEREKEKEREARQGKEGSKDDQGDADTQQKDDSKNEQEMKSKGQPSEEAAVSASAQNGSETKEAEVGAASRDIVMFEAEEEKASTLEDGKEEEPDGKTSVKGKSAGTKGNQKELEKEKEEARKGKSQKAAPASTAKEAATRRSTRSSKSAQETGDDDKQATIDVSQEPDNSTPKAAMPASKTAAEPTTAVSKNSEMVEAEQAMNGTKNIDGEEAERGGRGVKRPAEEEARGGQDADAGSLRIAPSAKRHKTDAEWGKSSSEGAGDPFLLACRFFDRECAGYLDADDLEEIAFMVSDGISRRRVQTLVDNVTKHGKLRYLEHSQLRIPPALPPVAEEMKSTASLAAAVSGPAVSDKEWKALLGKLASSEKVRRAADASIAAKDEEAAKAAEQYQELQAEEQQAQAQIKTLKEQLTGMRSSRFRANDLLSKGLDSIQSSVAQLNALKEQMEGAQAALRKVETPSSRVADGQIDNKA